MTDADIADHVYFEPITVSTVKKILEREKPDGIIANLGGQVGLNMALALHKEGVLEKTGIPLLGMPWKLLPALRIGNCSNKPCRSWGSLYPKAQ